MSHRALKKITPLGIIAFCLALAVSCAAASAAEFKPERDLTVVHISSPGGGMDVCGRAILKVINDLKLSPVNWIIDYRVGGGGAKGYSYVANKRGDNYMIAQIASSYFTTPLLGDSPVSYKDFVPVASMIEDPYIMIVKANSEITSLDDIKKKGYMLAGTAAIAADQALIAQQLKGAMGIEADILPHGGSKCCRPSWAATSTSYSATLPNVFASSRRARCSRWLSARPFALLPSFPRSRHSRNSAMMWS